MTQVKQRTMAIAECRDCNEFIEGPSATVGEEVGIDHQGHDTRLLDEWKEPVECFECRDYPATREIEVAVEDGKVWPVPLCEQCTPDALVNPGFRQ